MHPLSLRSAVKLVGSRRPVGKVGETHGVFPGLPTGDRAGAVRRGSAQPTVHKFTASARHGVRRPVSSLRFLPSRVGIDASDSTGVIVAVLRVWKATGASCRK